MLDKSYTGNENLIIVFFKYLLLCSWAWIGQTKYIVMMTSEELTKIVNFMTTNVVLGCGHIDVIVKLLNFI